MSAHAQRPAMKNSEQRRLERAAGRAQLGACLSTVASIIFGTLALATTIHPVTAMTDSLPDVPNSGESVRPMAEISAAPTIAPSGIQGFEHLLKISIPLILGFSCAVGTESFERRSKKISEDLDNLRLDNLRKSPSHQPT